MPTLHPCRKTAVTLPHPSRPRRLYSDLSKRLLEDYRTPVLLDRRESVSRKAGACFWQLLKFRHHAGEAPLHIEAAGAQPYSAVMTWRRRPGSCRRESSGGRG